MLSLKAPPALLLLIAGALILGLDSLWPALSTPFPGHRLLALAAALSASLLVAAGGLAFRRARTTVNPMNPTQARALVTAGVYRYTRNPMYLGFVLLLVGWALYLANLPALLVVVGFIGYMNRYQIHPEERTLARLFGAAYREYCQRVRRWL
ncbi:methyltransferase family protein [Alkalilimnicola sp. S0819]|uniref:methyltransferase family protein n=1 Tax=Alkalilimnicola sp. S0819 TaxID=2613922 RepID=UPI00126208E9|nr:isoprenylcysteine carboxylmethyltransferase family protein [Alkalilimnicola sp. S0819]KAB7622581.1 isoprenylcysteine carboxylmethyltransferase family protein [Alkalilimnicola sp. S0819]MPQ17469.1 isoprenylcysteine carboxylmethyltransferase family protein [Alkalilimnicola sp. S0819]